QAVSGAGVKALEEMEAQMRTALDGGEPETTIFPYPIAFNCLPQIPHKNAFESNGYSTEEIKMINETKKIMGDDAIRVTATTVRVPVRTGHSESVNIETAVHLTPDEARAILTAAPGVVVMDDPANDVFPTALHAAGRDETFVGR